MGANKRKKRKTKKEKKNQQTPEPELEKPKIPRKIGISVIGPVLALSTAALGIAGYFFYEGAEQASQTVQEISTETRPEVRPLPTLQTLDKIVTPIGFYELSQEPLQPSTQRMEEAKVMAHLGLTQSGEGSLVSVEPKIRRDIVYFAPNDPLVTAYVQNQQNYINTIKNYFSIDLTATVVAASNEQDLARSEYPHFRAGVVAFRQQHDVFIMHYSQNGEHKSRLIADQDPLPMSEVRYTTRGFIRDGVIATSPQDIQVILTPHQIEGIPFDVSGCAEFLHFALYHRTTQDDLSLITQDQITSGHISYDPRPTALNEAVVHGTLLAALEDLKLFNAEQSETMIRLWNTSDPQHYGRTQEFYAKSKKETPLVVFRNYQQGVYSNFSE